MTKASERTPLNRDRLQEAIDDVVGDSDDIDTDAIADLYVAKTLKAEGKKPWYVNATAGALMFVIGLFSVGLILRAGVEFFAWGYTVPDKIEMLLGL